MWLKLMSDWLLNKAPSVPSRYRGLLDLLEWIDVGKIRVGRVFADSNQGSSGSVFADFDALRSHGCFDILFTAF